MTVADLLTAHHLIPVVVVTDAAQAQPLADALIGGGLPVAEVTLRTEAGLPAIKALAGRPEILLGAGTVTTAAQLEQAVEAGARFVVSPGFSPRLAERAAELAVPLIPGAVTATEIQAALEHGIDLLKFFPAATSGGAAAIKALGGPFRQVSFVPTGGIGPANLAEYLRLPGVAAIGGSWMVPTAAIRQGAFGRVRELVAEAVAQAAGIVREVD
ncbi:MAG: bifunctional 4-hydroxy-2-oxoglutarate aldolase/2-dehydro-3-deoxy-phosphogluconate aldolase [Bifidobacteriaceae bacterium]|jgi:2-dehydro-3-deoxyphosphogluconate aldolase/(4S)-4-hydroxy-2-oxoglutarate aldolase|nr:bifunctional 4-hydroxy-2-oxoglutarate aldolase/2-dehydro-3-deoxy-phosphogluconate aldolase [Bifidobacteriaceae bacterium]